MKATNFFTFKICYLSILTGKIWNVDLVLSKSEMKMSLKMDSYPLVVLTVIVLKSKVQQSISVNCHINHMNIVMTGKY